MTKTTARKYSRNAICVILPDGYKLHITNRATKDGLKFSDVVRMALKRYLHL